MLQYSFEYCNMIFKKKEMKKILTIILTVLCFSGWAQRKAVIADLKIENLKFEDMQNTSLNPDLLE